jgi:ferredoxin
LARPGELTILVSFVVLQFFVFLVSFVFFKAKKGGNISTKSGFRIYSAIEKSGSKKRAHCKAGERVIACHLLLTSGAAMRRSCMGR